MKDTTLIQLQSLARDSDNREIRILAQAVLEMDYSIQGTQIDHIQLKDEIEAKYKLPDDEP